jgi:renalase
LNGATVLVRTPFKRYVVNGPATALAKHVGQGVTIRTECTIHSVRRVNDRWTLTDGKGQEMGDFGELVMAVPAQQAIALLGAADPLSSQLAQVTMTPLWALMAGLSRPSGHAFDAARVEGSPFAWMMRTPGRNGVQAECWTVHVDPVWSAHHVELEPSAVCDQLRATLQQTLGGATLAHLSAHRWRYALAGNPLGHPHLHDPSRHLTLVGDWCLGDRAEHAWLSGRSVPTH